MQKFGKQGVTTVALILGLIGVSAGMAAAQQPHQDWPEFGGNLESSSATSAPTGITAANIKTLHHQQVLLPGTVDSAAIYLHGVTVKGAPHDVFFLTTTYGKTVAVDAASGQILWVYTPPSYNQLAESRQVTNSSPAADPDRQYLYAASPDGMIQKLAIADGHSLWRTSVTRLPKREKLASGLKVYQGHVIAVTDGYIGDEPPYQGHVAVLDASTGKLLHVWNSLCSDRHELIAPDSCPATMSAIWGRSGAVIDTGRNAMFLATGNGPWNGTTNWGDALIELNLNATTLLGNFTPENTQEMEQDDADLGSTSPALLGHGLIAQGGKDKVIHLLSIAGIAGTAPHKGTELERVPTPADRMLFSSLAVWPHDGQTWLFAADGGALPPSFGSSGGTEAWTLDLGGKPHLVSRWKNGINGTSPLVADGLLYVYNPAGGLHVYSATTGAPIATLATGPGHWNSPIVVDGRIALPEGNANHHSVKGVLDIWSLAAGGTGRS